MDLSSKDERFIWPGEEGFTGFPKHLPQDCIEYTIHIVSTTIKSNAQVRSRLNQIRQGANELVKRHLKGYIWQRDAFELEIVPQVGGGFLYGKTVYGDSIADEWLIVYLLRELSKHFEDAWFRVSDADGEFLLIEAANVLPRWLNPEVAEYRVWINRGDLRIISLTNANQKPAAFLSDLKVLTREMALSIILNNPSQLSHSPQVEEEAFYRLRNYPAQIKDSLHTALLSVPRNLAFILHNTPAYVSPAVEAFYLRDPISIKPLQNQSPKCLWFQPKDLVTIGVQFTRVGYAQLKSQEFQPPPAWVLATKDLNASQIGMKLSCGFEMLLADPQHQDKKSVREIKLLLEDVENGEPLPTDSEIATWPANDDDEAWLDVKFEDFENELAGRTGVNRSTNDAGKFGDKAAQENLRKIVEKFEQFLNDEDAGAEGAEFEDEMDFDDDDDNISSSIDGEDRDASFDEEEFDNAMREMMGLPPEKKITGTEAVPVGENRVQELEPGDDTDDEEQIREISKQMEAELTDLGALRLDHNTTSTLISGNSAGGAAAFDDERSLDYQLAKNLLESFASQAGEAGPAGNMMNLMGLKLPRNEEHD